MHCKSDKSICFTIQLPNYLATAIFYNKVASQLKDSNLVINNINVIFPQHIASYTYVHGGNVSFKYLIVNIIIVLLLLW